MIKTVGAILIFISSILLGFRLGEKKKTGYLECVAFLGLMTYAKSQIEGFFTPTKLIWRGYTNEILEKNGFLPVLRGAESEEVYFDAFSRAFDRTKDRFSMPEAAKSVIVSFGGIIGKSDVDEQISKIDRLTGEMEEICKKAKDDSTRDAKMFLTLGFSVGAAVFIMLI